MSALTDEEIINRITAAIAKITQPREDGIGVAWTNRSAAIQAWNEVKAIRAEEAVQRSGGEPIDDGALACHPPGEWESMGR